MIERLKNIAKTTKVSASNKKNIMTNNMRERVICKKYLLSFF